jgi:hypothetical protein
MERAGVLVVSSLYDFSDMLALASLSNGIEVVFENVG